MALRARTLIGPSSLHAGTSCFLTLLQPSTAEVSLLCSLVDWVVLAGLAYAIDPRIRARSTHIVLYAGAYGHQLWGLLKEAPRRRTAYAALGLFVPHGANYATLKQTLDDRWRVLVAEGRSSGLEGTYLALKDADARCRYDVGWGGAMDADEASGMVEKQAWRSIGRLLSFSSAIVFAAFSRQR